MPSKERKEAEKKKIKGNIGMKNIKFTRLLELVWFIQISSACWLEGLFLKSLLSEVTHKAPLRRGLFIVNTGLLQSP